MGSTDVRLEGGGLTGSGAGPYNPRRNGEGTGMRRSWIMGTGACLPTEQVDNAAIAGRLGIAAEAVFRRTGIRTRRWAGAGETASSLAEGAARQALQAAGLEPDQLDAILVSTTSPDTLLPSTACHLQRRLGAPAVMALDVAASCSGFLYGLSMADCLVRSGQARRCLVVAAEVKSRFLDLDDAATAVLFADGAGAVVVGEAEDEAGGGLSPGIIAVRLYADGSRAGLISMAAGGSRRPPTPETVRERRHVIRLKGGPLFRLAVRRLAGAVQDLMKEHGVGPRELGRVVFHQANGRLLEAIRQRLGIPPDKLWSVIERYGNASSASLPIALDHAVRAKAVASGDLLLLGTFGGGLTWATALVRW